MEPLDVIGVHVQGGGPVHQEGGHLPGGGGKHVNALLHSGCTPPHAWSSSTAHISARIHRRTMTIFENVTKTGMFFIDFFFETVHIKIMEEKNKNLVSVI